MRGQTLTIPAGLSGSQEISSGGQSITAQPGESKKPESDGNEGGGGGGGGGIGGLFAGIVGAAGKAASGLADAGKGAMGLATGAGGVAAGSLASTFSTTANDVGGLVSSLNGIQQAFPADQLSQAGLGAAMGALNLGRDSSNWLKSVGNLVNGFDSLTPEVQQQARENMRQYAGPGGPLEQAGQAMRSFSEFPWESEVPATQNPTPSATQQPTTSVPPTNTATFQSTLGISTTQSPVFSTASIPTTASTSTSSATPSTTPETRKRYLITTKNGTTLETFEGFVQDLDGGAGKSRTYEYVPHQSYLTHLALSDVERIKQLDFIWKVVGDVFVPPEEHQIEEYGVISRGVSTIGERTVRNANKSEGISGFIPEHDATILPRALLPAQPNAPYWKKMISSPPPQNIQQPPPPSQDPPYLCDDSGGTGTTIYVLNAGFDLSIAVSLSNRWTYLTD